MNTQHIHTISCTLLLYSFAWISNSTSQKASLHVFLLSLKEIVMAYCSFSHSIQTYCSNFSGISWSSIRLPDNLCKLITNNHAVRTQRSNDMFLDKPKIRGINITHEWNKPPLFVRKSINISTFKSSLKTYLFFVLHLSSFISLYFI